MDVAIIDYNMSNLFSVQAACKKVGLSSVITSDPARIISSKIAVLPGVGAFGEAMKQLHDLKLDDCIYNFFESGKPLIGICLGLQLLFEKSEEFGYHSGLGIIKGEVVKFDSNRDDNFTYPVPQIGWNRIKKNKNKWKGTPLCDNIDNDFMYFIHSYYVNPENSNIILTNSNYGKQEYCSSIHYKNIFAFQFHPEKSGEIGLKIYRQLKSKFTNE